MILAKLEYSIDILIFSVPNEVIKAFCERSIIIFFNSYISIICITNIYFFKFTIANANSFLPIISTCQAVSTTFVIVYLFYLSSFSINHISLLLKI